MSRYAFQRCMRGDPEFWTQEAMEQYLSGEELAGLCEAMGIPYSGTARQKINRLLNARDLREILSGYNTSENDHHQTEAACNALAEHFKGRELREMCRRAGAYAGSTKYARAAGLLQWRDSCRKRGCNALRAAQERRRESGRPRQIEMAL